MKQLFKCFTVVVLLATGCGGGSGDGNGGSPPAEDVNPPVVTPPQEDVLPASCVGVTTSQTVSIVDLTFAPREFVIAVGNFVRFINNDTVTHTVTSGEPNHSNAGALFDQTLDPGESFCVQINVRSDSDGDDDNGDDDNGDDDNGDDDDDDNGNGDDDVDYFCRIHPEMLGEIKF